MFTDGGSLCHLLRYSFNLNPSEKHPFFSIFIPVCGFSQQYNGRHIIFLQPIFLPPKALLHGICNFLCFVQASLEWNNFHEHEFCRWIIASLLAIVDGSSIPVIMPATFVSTSTFAENHWFLILDEPHNEKVHTSYAFVYHSGADSNWEVEGLDGLLSSPQFNAMKEDQLVVVLRSIFDGMDLLSESEVTDFFTLAVARYTYNVQSSIVCNVELI